MERNKGSVSIRNISSTKIRLRRIHKGDTMGTKYKFDLLIKYMFPLLARKKGTMHCLRQLKLGDPVDIPPKAGNLCDRCSPLIEVHRINNHFSAFLFIISLCALCILSVTTKWAFVELSNFKLKTYRKKDINRGRANQT